MVYMSTQYRIEKHSDTNQEIVFEGNVSIEKLCEKLGILVAQTVQCRAAASFQIYDEDTLIAETRVPRRECTSD